MKKILIPAALCCALMACGGAKTNSGSADNKADASAVVVSADNNFVMPDGRIAELRGKVKSAKISNTYTSGLEYPDENFIFTIECEQVFNEKGEMMFPSDEYSVSRDSQGRIIEVNYERQYSEQELEEMDGYDPGSSSSNHYHYAQDGSLDSLKSYLNDHNGTIKYTYDSNGNVEKGMVDYLPATSEIWETHELAYKIKESDSHGNWTKRDIVRKFWESERGPESARTETLTQTREIVYY